MLPSKLLLSLQSVEELQSIRGWTFPWLDLKNPGAGSLGCPEAGVAEAFLVEAERQVDRNQCQLSIAIGELTELAWSEILPIVAEFDFAKVALAGCVARKDWKPNAIDLAAELPAPDRLILVHYADHHRAAAPDWAATLETAVALSSRFLLIDTFDKSAGRLWDYYSPDRIQELAKEASAKGIRLSIAGSLRLDDLPRARQLGAAVVGVRGAACQDGSRVLGLSRDRIKMLSEIFAH